MMLQLFNTVTKPMQEIQKTVKNVSIASYVLNVSVFQYVAINYVYKINNTIAIFCGYQLHAINLRG